MIENPYLQHGNWYKGCIHVHSNNSDGDSSPEDVYRWYYEHGYDFLAITDHDFFTKVNPSVDIICIPGEERSNPFPRGHAIALGIKYSIGRELTDQEWIDEINSQGGVSILAHPNIHTQVPYDWPGPYDQGWRDETIASLLNFGGMEIYNHITLLRFPSGYAVDKWDTALSRGQKCWGFAVDDAHVMNESESLVGWIMVKASSRDKDALLASIKKGSFYASTGVSMEDIRVVKNTIKIRTEVETRIRFIGEGGKLLKVVGGKGRVEGRRETEYQVKGNEGYVRVECNTGSAKFAWLQPFFLRV